MSEHSENKTVYQLNFEHPVHVHFIGIGGISMSGLAEILLLEGFTVSGSDNTASALTEHLTALGAKVSIGQCAENITSDIDVVVYTAAIHPDNPEFARAKSLGLPMLSRAQLLGQLMHNYRTPIAISGTHGKTTTTSMVSEILLRAGTDPTLSVGGILKSIGGNIRVGGNEYFVAEACEYTNSYLEFFPRISIILNVEEDHMDFFHDLAEIRDSFRRFASLLPEDGTLIINGMIDRYSELTSGLSCEIITFGDTDAFDYYPSDITYDENGRAAYTLHRSERILTSGSSLSPTEDVKLGVVGKHNIFNSLAAFALADRLSITPVTVTSALEAFNGTDRRFEEKGSLGDIKIIDDYAHHPTEISATLQAAHQYPHHEIWCVFQPHTYTRTKAFLPEFSKALSTADHVILADIYAARETDTLGISSADIVDGLTALGTDACYIPDFDGIEAYLLEHVNSGDLIITMGAGNICAVGDHLLGK